MIVVALFLLQTAAAPAEPPAAAAYVRCITQQAARLSRSDESAEAVAIAALMLCKPLLTPAARALDAASNEELRKRGWSVGEIDSALRMESKLAEEAQKLAVTIAVEERLKAKTK